MKIKNPINSASFILTLIFMMFSIFACILSFDLYNDNLHIDHLGRFIFGVSGILFSIINLYKLTEDFKNKLRSFLLTEATHIIAFNYSEVEWRSFAEAYVTERDEKSIKYIYLLLLVPMIIYGFLRINGVTKSDEFLYVFILVLLPLLVALIILKFYYDFRDFKKAMLNYEQPEVLITNYGILINRTYVISYNNNDFRVGDCFITEFLNYRCIEINIPKGNGKHRYTDYHYILIPKDQEIDIISIASTLKYY